MPHPDFLSLAGQQQGNRIGGGYRMDGNSQFLQLFVAHQDGVRAFIRAMVRDPSTADDVFQETAIVLWQEFERYDQTRSFGAWARGIAGNKVLKAYARGRRRGVVLSPEAIDAVAGSFDVQEPEMEEERQALRACVERLPEHGRNLLELRYEKALSIAELAERVKRSEEAVHKALVRLRAALSKCVSFRLRPAGESC